MSDLRRVKDLANEVQLVKLFDVSIYKYLRTCVTLNYITSCCANASSEHMQEILYIGLVP